MAVKFSSAVLHQMCSALPAGGSIQTCMSTERHQIHLQGRGRVLDVLAEIQERNKAVKDLEQSLLELHQIFLDMAVLVEAQVNSSRGAEGLGCGI